MQGWIVGLILLVISFGSVAQQSDSTRLVDTDSLTNRLLYVDRVIIIGNKLTKNRIIERELSLKPGDTISSKLLKGSLTWDKNKLYNLPLFNTVSVRALDLTNNHVDLLVEVTERWYIFPVPIFELSDRNIN